MSNIQFDMDYNLNDGIIILFNQYDVNSIDIPTFSNIGDEYIIQFANLQNVSKFTKFEYDTVGTADERYLKQYFRNSRNGTSWSDWFELKKHIDNFPLVDPLDPLFIDIKWIREGNSTLGDIKILEFELEGKLERPIDDDDVVNIPTSGSKIIKPPFIYKVFGISDLEIISSPMDLDIPGLSLKYRFSQDSTRTWSNWEILTKENISTLNISPIRFFQIEYLIENNSGQNVNIQDINLIGDFQNVTLDGRKSNLFGIRECCNSKLNGTFDADGNFIPNTNLNEAGGGSCPIDNFESMSDENKANLYNPYQQDTAQRLLDKLSGDAEQVFGHKVTYFVTDPDAKGQDHSLNEFQLYNVVCKEDIKISVSDNNFPDSQIVMNQFDLNLFETMEVHITKKQFKEAFGVQRRPSKEDFLYFCDVNRMYQVDHAQQFRNFNNAAVYYKLILKKYSQKANVQAGNNDIQNVLDKLTNNSTIDQLMGIEQTRDKSSVANKPQIAPLTRDPIRLEYFVDLDRELIENSSTIISKSHYDLSSVNNGNIAVQYKNLDPILKVSSNIGFMMWFNINNYIQDEVYNFMKHYDDSNSLGWKVNLVNDTFKVTLNNDEYDFDLEPYTSGDPTGLYEDTWYCYVLNINQRDREIEQYIYKRDVIDEDDAPSLTSTILKNVYKDKQTMVPISYEIRDNYPVVLGSDMKATNLRLFVDIIPEDTHNKILNQAIIRDDSKYLVFADNANTRIVLPHFPLFE